MTTKYKKGTFILIPNKEYLVGRGADIQAVYMWLCNYLDDDGKCFPSRNTLAKQVGCSVRTVDKYLLELESIGLITKELRKKTGTSENLSNMYTINFLHYLEHEVGYPSVETCATPSARNSTVTQSNINSNILTTVDDVHDVNVKPQNQDNVSEQEKTILSSGQLPERLGSTPYKRLICVYKALWREFTGTDYQVTAWGQMMGLFRRIATNNTERQIACLMHIHFNWYGVSGDNKKDHEFLAGLGYPLTMLLKNLNVYIAYLTNTLGIDYTSEDAINTYLAKNLKKTLSQYGT